MRFAIIGCGVIGRLHAEVISGLQPEARLVATVDLHQDRARALADRYGTIASVSPGDIFTRGDVDAVAICTPSGTHADLAVPALEMGKHVIIEKPIDVDLGAARRVAEAERGSSAMATVISQHRFDPASQVVIEAVRRGRFGRLTSGNVSIAWWRSQAYYDSGGWRGTRALDGGGALMNQGIHSIDLLVWFLGEPVEVFAFEACLAHERIEVEDTAVAAVRFANGALGVIHGTTAAYPGLTARVQVHGDRGSAIIDDDRLTYFYAASDGEDAPDYGEDQELNQASTVLPAESRAPSAGSDPSALSNAHGLQYRDFLDAIDSGKPPLVGVAEGTRTLAVVRGLYESAQTGRPVPLQI